MLAIRDTNDYSQVTGAFEPVLALARTHGACILLVHHAGKAERAGLEAVMGSTAWAGSVDNVLLLNRRERYRLLSSVQRIGRDLEETVVLMDAESGELRFGGTRYLVDLQHVTDAMRALLHDAAADGVPREQLLRDVEARRDLKLKALATLAADQAIERIGAGTRNNPHRYRERREPETAVTPCFDSGSLVPDRAREPETTSLFRQ
jgi:hypothetical protein